MDVELAFQLLFAAGVLAVTAAFAAVAAAQWSPRLPLLLAGVLAAAAAAGWIAVVFRASVELAVAAAGLTGCCAAAAGAGALARTLARGRRIEDELRRAERRLADVVARESAERAAEFERTLARTRAESISLLAHEERRIAEERRRAVADHERQASSEMGRSLAAAQARLEQRLASWAEDLERAQQALAAQVARLGQRQKQLLDEGEARIETEAKRLDAEADQQRASVSRLREELARAAEEAVSAARAELETHAAERRRALHEVSERLRARERELHEQIERQETEAAGRIRASFADVERRQTEQLERVLARASSRYAEAAAQQFDDATKASREAAAKRLSRELERAVATYVSEAQSILGERLAHVADAGTQRLEKRFGQVAAGIERQRDELLASLERRVAGAEADLRRRLDALAADAEAERGILEARLHEVARRIEELTGRAHERLVALRRSDS